MMNNWRQILSWQSTNTMELKRYIEDVIDDMEDQGLNKYKIENVIAYVEEQITHSDNIKEDEDYSLQPLYEIHKAEILKFIKDYAYSKGVSKLAWQKTHPTFQELTADRQLMEGDFLDLAGWQSEALIETIDYDNSLIELQFGEDGPIGAFNFSDFENVRVRSFGSMNKQSWQEQPTVATTLEELQAMIAPNQVWYPHMGPKNDLQRSMFITGDKATARIITSNEQRAEEEPDQSVLEVTNARWTDVLQGNELAEISYVPIRRLPFRLAMGKESWQLQNSFSTEEMLERLGPRQIWVVGDNTDPDRTHKYFHTGHYVKNLGVRDSVNHPGDIKIQDAVWSASPYWKNPQGHMGVVDLNYSGSWILYENTEGRVGEVVSWQKHQPMQEVVNVMHALQQIGASDILSYLFILSNVTNDHVINYLNTIGEEETAVTLENLISLSKKIGNAAMDFYQDNQIYGSQILTFISDHIADSGDFSVEELDTIQNISVIWNPIVKVIHNHSTDNDGNILQINSSRKHRLPSIAEHTFPELEGLLC